MRHHTTTTETFLWRMFAAVLAGGLLVTVALVDSVAARELDDRHEKVTREIERSAAQLDQSSERLVAATRRHEEAAASLRDAQDTLARTRGELAAARAFDVQMQHRLDAAVEDLRRARTELAHSRQQAAKTEKRLGQIAVESYQSGAPALMALSMVLHSQDPVELGSQLNFVRSVLDKEAVALERLEASRVLLTVKESRFREAKVEVAEQRSRAAENLRHKQDLEMRAEQAEASIRQLVVSAAAARDEVAAAKTEDEQQLRELESERERISAMLRERAREARAQAAAEAKARAAAEAREAARKAAAATRAAREAQRLRDAQAAREAARTAQEAREAARQAQASAREARQAAHTRDHARSVTPKVSRSGVRPTTSFTLSRPVDGYITSSYGMRLHPVYKRWSLHDGTDYGASCGTPIRAAASGRVLAVYYNSAYGNRVILDHGYERGVGLGTAYNHLSRFSTYAGQTVQRGEVIGYVGNTGYSTGCHLHFMVFENGGTVDPMGWL